MIGLTAVKYCEIDMIFLNMWWFFLENDQIISNPFLFIVSEFVHSICAYRIIPFWKGLERDLKTLKSSSLHRSMCSKIFLTLVLKRHHSWKKIIYAFTSTFERSFWNAKSRIACAIAESLFLLYASHKSYFLVMISFQSLSWTSYLIMNHKASWLIIIILTFIIHQHILKLILYLKS